MATTDFINVTSATQLVNQISSSATNLAATLQQGVGSVGNSLTSAVNGLLQAGVSGVNAIQGGITSLMSSTSASSNIANPPVVADNTVQNEQQAAKMDNQSDLKYPPDLREYFMEFVFYKYVKPLASEPVNKVEKCRITLPIPPSLGEQFNMQYDTFSPGVLINAFQEVGGAAMASGDKGGIMAAMTAAGKAVGKAVDVPSAAKLLTQEGARKAFGDSAASAVGQSLGFTPNPHIGLLFKGVNLRSNHQFAYKFAPRNADESRRIRKIIKQFKYRMHPTMGSSLTLDYPDMCDIKIHRPPQEGSNGVTDDLIVYKSSFLETMGVNYAPGGSPTFFAGTREPTEIELQLQFKEAEIFTRRDFGPILDDPATNKTPKSGQSS